MRSVIGSILIFSESIFFVAKGPSSEELQKNWFGVSVNSTGVFLPGR